MTYDGGYDRAREVKEFDDSKIGVKGLVDSGIEAIPRFFVHPPENLAGLRSSSSAVQLPIIDLSELNTGGRADIVRRVHNAAREFGFFQIVNHGVPAEVLEAAIAAVKAFHEMPAAEKAVHYGRTYEGGVSFHCNYDLFQSKAASWRDTLQIRTSPVAPDWERVPAICRRELKEWDARVTAVAEVVTRLLSEGLGLERERLNQLSCLEGRSLVAHYYPFCPQPDLTMGIVSHADPGPLTILLQNEVAGLQVKHKGEWVDAAPVDGGLIVNVGDLLQIMSNDAYKSVEHRVIANPLRDPRISIVVLFIPGKGADLDEFGPLAELLLPDKPPLYRNFTITEYMQKFRSKELGPFIDNFKL